jgi:hypothetical protein
MELKEALVIVLIFLAPLSIYCLVLALLNRRPGPVLVSGTWDFLGMVFGLSGFLLAGGPAILSNVNGNWRGWFRPGAAPAGAWQRLLMTALLVLYFVLLAAGVALLLRRRRGTTAVYNVETARFDDVLGQVLDSLGLAWTRAGNRIYIRLGADLPAAPPAYAAGHFQPSHSLAVQEEARKRVEAVPLPSAAPSEQAAVVEMDPFPLMRHVTLRWGQTETALRQEVEGELARALSGVRTHYNPVSGWLLSAASALFILIFLLLVFLLAASLLIRS